jgi:hypothetical protein
LTPARGLPFFSSGVYPKVTPTTLVASTASGPVTLTPAQVLSGLVVVDCQDVQSMNLPTAAALNAALPGVAVGTTVTVDLVNYGDSILTVVLGGGMTKQTLGGLSAVLTVAAGNAKRFLLVCGSVAAGSEAWVVYALGGAAAVA